MVRTTTPTTNRLKALMVSMFPALKRALDLNAAGALTRLTGYQTPAAIRRTGKNRLVNWLRTPPLTPHAT